jgi:hypothetical protein
MFFLRENLSDPDQQWADLAASVTNDPYGIKITLKTDIGTGHFKTVEFEDGLKIVLTDYTNNRLFSKVYDNSKDDSYCLHINQVKAADQFSVFINDKELLFNNKLYTSVFLVCSGEPLAIKTTPGTYFNQLKIVIPKAWLSCHLAEAIDANILQQYLDLRGERLYFDSLDAVYLKLVNRLVSEVEQIAYLPLVHGIVTIIIERFFFRMKARMEKG